jgi:hypothetical protein
MLDGSMNQNQGNERANEASRCNSRLTRPMPTSTQECSMRAWEKSLDRYTVSIEQKG